MTDPILALDLASRSGWALGVPGARPLSGSIRFAREGHSMAAHFAGCRDWLDAFVAVNKPRVVIFEAPIAPSFMIGHTTTTTARALLGLIGMVEGTLYGRGFDVREASVSDVRRFFLGSARIKSKDAKAATVRRCVELGWRPADDNAADALALWAYMISILSPADGVKLLPLFGRTSA